MAMVDARSRTVRAQLLGADVTRRRLFGIVKVIAVASVFISGSSRDEKS